jgi:hypothetical protein
LCGWKQFAPCAQLAAEHLHSCGWFLHSTASVAALIWPAFPDMFVFWDLMTGPTPLILAWSKLPTTSRHPKRVESYPRSRGSTSNRPLTPGTNPSLDLLYLARGIRFRPSRCWSWEWTEMLPLSLWIRSFTKGRSSATAIPEHCSISCPRCSVRSPNCGRTRAEHEQE